MGKKKAPDSPKTHPTVFGEQPAIKASQRNVPFQKIELDATPIDIHISWMHCS